MCPLYIFGNKPPQMVPMDSNIGGTRVWRLCFRAKFTTLVTELSVSCFTMFPRVKPSGIQDTSTASMGLSGFDLQPDPKDGGMITDTQGSMVFNPGKFSPPNC